MFHGTDEGWAQVFAEGKRFVVDRRRWKPWRDERSSVLMPEGMQWRLSRVISQADLRAFLARGLKMHPDDITIVGRKILFPRRALAPVALGFVVFQLVRLSKQADG